MSASWREITQELLALRTCEDAPAQVVPRAWLSRWALWVRRLKQKVKRQQEALRHCEAQLQAHAHAQFDANLALHITLRDQREEAREAAGRLLFRYAPGLEGERWREEYPWLQEAYEAARALWAGRP